MLKRTFKKIYILLKYRGKRIRLIANCNIGLSAKFEGMNIIHRDSCFDGSIGYGSYIGEKSSISGKIGRFSSIGSHVIVADGNHPTRDFVSSHPAFYSLLKQSGETFVKTQKFSEHVESGLEYSVSIGNDVWIGTNVTILSGVSIGDGAIVAAGSVVTKSVFPYSIVGGVPAKEIRKRFDDEQIDFLQRMAWWNRSTDWIRNNAEWFESITLFMKHFQQSNDQEVGE